MTSNADFLAWNIKGWLQAKKITIAQKSVDLHFLGVAPAKIRYTFDIKVAIVAKFYDHKVLNWLAEMSEPTQNRDINQKLTEALLSRVEGIVYTHVKHLGECLHATQLTLRGKVHEFKWIESPGIGKHGFELRTNIRLNWRDIKELQIHISHACRVTNKHNIAPRVYVEKQRVFAQPQ